nr:unnamed protein product [Callosobruchus analis]
MSSDEEDVFIISALCEEAEKQIKKKESVGYIIYVENVKSMTKLNSIIIRMSHGQFMKLLGYLKPEIERQNTSFRQAIGPEERLAVCLRWRYLTVFFILFLDAGVDDDDDIGVGGDSWLRGIRLDQLHLRIAWEKLPFEKLYIQLVT